MTSPPFVCFNNNSLARGVKKLEVRRNILGLTALRGFAACWVVIAHFREVRFDTLINLNFLNPLVDWGGLGVDLFFCLSGYVISHVYFGQFARSYRGSDYAKFLLYRLGRLYPVHILTMVVMLIFFAVASHVAVRPAVAEHFDATTVIANIFLLQGWWTVLGSPNGPAWTVSSEWLIYMCWPVLVFVTVRLTKDMRLVRWLCSSVWFS